MAGWCLTIFLLGPLLYPLKRVSCLHVSDHNQLLLSAQFLDKNSRVVLVLLTCDAPGVTTNESMSEAIAVSNRHGIKVTFARCYYDPITKKFPEDGRETGIILRWIISNYDRLADGSYKHVIFNHAHENSWHQSHFSVQLDKLLSERDYLLNNDYGDVYPYFIDHPIKISPTTGASSVPYCFMDIVGILSRITNGTRINYFNRTNSYNVWRSGQSTSFFVSNTAILRYTKEEYVRFLENTLALVKQSRGRWNYHVSEVTERSWYVIFTNKTWIEYRTLPPQNIGRTQVYSFVQNGCGSEIVYPPCPWCLPGENVK